MNPTRSTITAFIITLNEERNLKRCLESLTFCDQILVIDSGSTDRTEEIAKSFGCRFITNPWNGFVAQKQFGLDNCDTEWVLNIDADEEVSPELKDEIITMLETDGLSKTGEKTNGYELSRVVFFLGRWWRHGGWYPEYRLRLCRRSKCIWGGDEPHERATVSGPVRRMEGELRHYTYSSFSEQIKSLNSHSEAAAGTVVKKGKKVGITSMFISSLSRFLKFYIFKKGFLEGRAGFIVAVYEAFYAFMKYSKAWEKQRGWNKRDK